MCDNEVRQQTFISVSGTEEKEASDTKKMKITQRGKKKKSLEVKKIILPLRDLQSSACFNYLKEIERQLIPYLPILRDNIGHQTVLQDSRKRHHEMKRLELGTASK